MATCVGCKFFHDAGSDATDLRRHMFSCVRYPPTPMPAQLINGGQSVAVMPALFPIISDKTPRCGEFKAAETQ